MKDRVRECERTDRQAEKQKGKKIKIKNKKEEKKDR